MFWNDSFLWWPSFVIPFVLSSWPVFFLSLWSTSHLCGFHSFRTFHHSSVLRKSQTRTLLAEPSVPDLQSPDFVRQLLSFRKTRSESKFSVFSLTYLRYKTHKMYCFFWELGSWERDPLGGLLDSFRCCNFILLSFFFVILYLVYFNNCYFYYFYLDYYKVICLLCDPLKQFFHLLSLFMWLFRYRRNFYGIKNFLFETLMYRSVVLLYFGFQGFLF